jgi:hypothetical protein
LRILEAYVNVNSMPAEGLQQNCQTVTATYAYPRRTKLPVGRGNSAKLRKSAVDWQLLQNQFDETLEQANEVHCHLKVLKMGAVGSVQAKTFWWTLGIDYY